MHFDEIFQVVLRHQITPNTSQLLRTATLELDSKFFGNVANASGESPGLTRNDVDPQHCLLPAAAEFMLTTLVRVGQHFPLMTFP